MNSLYTERRIIKEACLGTYEDWREGLCEYWRSHATELECKKLIHDFGIKLEDIPVKFVDNNELTIDYGVLNIMLPSR